MGHVIVERIERHEGFVAVYFRDGYALTRRTDCEEYGEEPEWDWFGDSKPEDGTEDHFGERVRLAEDLMQAAAEA